MRICKFCNKPIEEGDIVWNPDENEDGYHHLCLVQKEQWEHAEKIYQKGRIDILKQIRGEINNLKFYGTGSFWDGINAAVEVVNKYLIKEK